MTVLNLFRDRLYYTHTLFMFEHVISGNGGENVDVWRFMIASHNFLCNYWEFCSAVFTVIIGLI